MDRFVVTLKACGLFDTRNSLVNLVIGSLFRCSTRSFVFFICEFNFLKIYDGSLISRNKLRCYYDMHVDFYKKLCFVSKE